MESEQALLSENSARIDELNALLMHLFYIPENADIVICLSDKNIHILKKIWIFLFILLSYQILIELRSMMI